MHLTLKPHQEMIVDWFLSHDEAAAFAGMGLGKTSATLATLDDLLCDGAIRGALVVAPLRVAVLTWPNELKKWDNFKHLRIVCLRTDEGKQAWVDGSADIYTINYEALPRFCNEYIKGLRKTKMPADVVVFDELSKAKNPSSKRIKAFAKYGGKFKKRWGLTGTPAPNGYLDLFAQIRLLDAGKTWGSKKYTDFCRKYFDVTRLPTHDKHTLRDGAKEKIDKLVSNIAITLRSKDYLKIPPVHVKDYEVILPKKARELYEEMQEEFLIELVGADIVAVNSAVRVNKLLQITSGVVYDEDHVAHHLHDAKIKALLKLHKEIGYQPLLVATQFKHEQDRLSKLKGAEKFSDDRLDAWNRGEIPIMYADPRSIGHGLNLQEGGHHAVWFSLTYSSELYDQFNARLARFGQEHETQIYRLTCPGTIGDAIAEVLEEKQATERSLMAAITNLQQLATAA